MKKLLFILLIAGYLFFLTKVNAQGVGVNSQGNAAHSSAGLDVDFVNKGMLIPRLTTVQRDAISSPAEGLMIVNTTTRCLEFYMTGAWQAVGCGCTSAPDPVASGIHVPTSTQVTWNWNSEAAATGYKWNTVNDYPSATNTGTMTSYTQTGLSCGNTYTLYVWAFNACGNSTVTTLTQATSACPVCPSATVTFTYKGSSVTYGTVTSNTNPQRCWLDRNLGASQVATAYNDANAYGDLFEWGRLDDGHQSRNSSTTSTLSTTDVPGHGNYILVSSSNNNGDWRLPQNNNLWQGVNGTNNPCPAGWRIPTGTEFTAMGISDYNVAFSNPLKLTAGGWRSVSTGSLSTVGSAGQYWTSNVHANPLYSVPFYFDGSSSVLGGDYRSTGMSVRCIKD